MDSQILGWDNDHHKQRLWIPIKNWDFKVFISSFKSFRTIFQFEGIVTAKEKGLAFMKAIGDIEIPSSVEYPDEDDPPPEYCGELNLFEKEDNPFLSITLFCNQSQYQELHRVFEGAFASNGWIGLELELKHAQGKDPDFWMNGWHDETIEIYKYGIFSGGEFKNKKWLTKIIDQI